MKKFGWLIAIIVVVGLYALNFYNSMVVLGPSLDNQYAQVQNMYERRADLIPQLAAVVKKYTEYEAGTLTGVIEARNTASKNLEMLTTMVEAGKVDSVDFSNLLSSTLGGLSIAVEAYPQLKADTQFTSLFAELEGSENRIRVEIKNYNDAVAGYNTKIVTFPQNYMAKIFGLSAKTSLVPPADKDVKTAPNVGELLN